MDTVRCTGLSLYFTVSALNMSFPAIYLRHSGCQHFMSYVGQHPFLWACWMRCAKFLLFTQNISGKTISLTCCFHHVTCVFAGSFSSVTSNQCYLSSLHMLFMSSIHPIYHLSFTIDWLTLDSCLQAASDTYIQHPLLTFSDEHLPPSPCYFSSLGGNCCKYALSYFITVLQISA